MKKIVLFDWGGVICKEDKLDDLLYEIFLECKTDLNKKDVLKEYFTILKEKENNICTLNKKKDLNNWYNHLKDKLHLKASLEEYKKISFITFKKQEVYQDLINYMYNLKNKCYVGILSNLMIYALDTLFYQVDKSKIDYLYLSCQIGLKKPDRKIYEYVTNNLKDFSILFIDNNLDNINEAIKHNWQGLVATGKDLDKIKRKVNLFLEEEK